MTDTNSESELRAEIEAEFKRIAGVEVLPIYNIPTAVAHVMEEVKAWHHQRLEAKIAESETIGRCKELEAGDILPDLAFEVGIEWYIQGVKVPEYLARKISNAAKERRDKLLAQLTDKSVGNPNTKETK